MMCDICTYFVIPSYLLRSVNVGLTKLVLFNGSPFEAIAFRDFFTVFFFNTHVPRGHISHYSVFLYNFKLQNYSVQSELNEVQNFLRQHQFLYACVLKTFGGIVYS
jgi:hypothetical protein